MSAQGISGEIHSNMDDPGSLKKHFGKYYPNFQKKKNVVSSIAYPIVPGGGDDFHEEATVVVIDAIGEWDTTIWDAWLQRQW